MNDSRHMLELAAKAIGIKKDDSPCNGGGSGNDGFDIAGNLVTDWHNGKTWNPLHNYADALRLALKLSFTVSMYSGEFNYCSVIDSDDYEVAYADINESPDFVCLAITRAAASIGEAME